MANVGYVRVSSIDQNPDRQLASLSSLDKIFTEKKSGKSTKNRPVWNECRNYLREGDVLHVHSMDRLARNLFDLKDIVSDLTAQGVVIKFLKENLVFHPDKTDPLSELLFHVIGAVAQFERELIRERQREGIVQAIKNGKRLGRKPVLTAGQKIAVYNMVTDGIPVATVAKEFYISRASVYRVMKSKKENQ